MKQFRDLKIGTKYGILFVLIILMAVYSSFNGISNLGLAKDRIDTIYNDDYIPMQYLNNTYISLVQVRAEAWQILASEDEKVRQGCIERIEVASKSSLEAINKYGEGQLTEEEKNIYNQLLGELQIYYGYIDEFVTAVKKGDFILATEIEEKMTSQVVILRVQADKLISLNNNSSLAQKNASDDAYNDIRKQMALIAVIATIIAITLFIITTRQTTIPLYNLIDNADIMAKGDLSQNISLELTSRKDEIGELAKAFEKLRSDLGLIIHNIAISSQEVAAASEELLASAEQIAATMQETSASTEEISAGMQEISASAEEVNASGEEVGAMLLNISHEADKGYEEAKGVEQRAIKVQNNAENARNTTLGIYNEIKERVAQAIKEAHVVEQISGLAESIDSIADQTNLLALNAAIEAARAGEHGRGFAVVAEEVRKLAEDSGEAVANIKELVSQVQGSIQYLVENSSKVLEFINDNVIKDYELIGEMGVQYKADADKLASITKLFNEEINKISVSMEEINQAIESTAATMEQSTAGSQEIARGSVEASQAANNINEAATKMAENAEKLLNLVTTFKI